MSSPCIKCKRCGVSYPILKNPPSQEIKEPTVYICELPNCERRYREHSSTGLSWLLYMLPKDVIRTIKASTHIKKHGGKVDNGGSQEGIN